MGEVVACWRLVVCGWVLAGVVAVRAQTTLVSSAQGGGFGNSGSQHCAVALGGALVAFDSVATNLVAIDTNANQDVFVRDRSPGLTELVSVSSTGIQGNGPSYFPALSFDGRFVAFISTATNLVPNDANGIIADVYVRDRLLGTTELVSVGSSGQACDGRCFRCSISGDGRFVLFDSEAINLTAIDNNGAADVFVRDRLAKKTECASLSAIVGTGNGMSFLGMISVDGRYATFSSTSSDLVASDLNGAWDVFVRDLVTQTTERVSVSSAGVEGNAGSEFPSLSLDGHFVAFSSAASNFCPGDSQGSWDVFLHDRWTHTTKRIVEAFGGGNPDGRCFGSTISPDASFVGFESEASNLVSGDTNATQDIFVVECATKRVRRVSISGWREQSNGWSEGPAVGWGGNSVAFTTYATNLVTGDPNRCSDVVMRHWVAASWEEYGQGWPGANGVPALTCSAPPVQGKDILIRIGNSCATASAGVLLYGEQEQLLATGFGGSLNVDYRILVPLALPVGGRSELVHVPEMPEWMGLVCCIQSVQVDPAASSGLAFSKGVRFVLGE